MNNILMVNYEYPPLGGGGGVFNKHLAEHLAKRYRVTVITSRFGRQPALEVVNGVELLRVPVPQRTDANAAGLASMLGFFPSSLWTGIKLLGRRHYDIVHSLFAVPSAPSGLLMAKLFGKPHLLSLLGGDIYDPSKKLSPHRTPFLGHAVTAVIRGSHAVISLSRDIRRRTYRHYRGVKGIEVVHLGIPKPRYERFQRADFGFRKEDILLVTVGRLVERKSVHELIQMIRDLNQPRVKLIVIGDGPQGRRLKRTAVAMDVHRQVRFLGNVDDSAKFGLMAMSDIFVSASQHEGFGLVFLEAMAVGLPVVSYDNGGQEEFLRNGQTGGVAPRNRRTLLLAKVRELVSDPIIRRTIGEHNQDRAANFFIESCARKYEEKYMELARAAA